MNPTDNKQSELEALIGEKLMKQLADQGYILVKKVKDEDDKKEADVSSAQPTAILAAKSKKEAFTNKLHDKVRFVESDSDATVQGTKFKVILIEEGLGNLGDLFYYPGSCLKEAAQVFEGKKIYADHPDAQEEQLRPERSVKDILGHFENVQFDDSDGRGKLIAEVNILPDEPFDWARALMKSAVDFAKKYPDKEFIGLSINASGDSEDEDLEEFLKSGEIPDDAKVKLQQALDQGAKSIRVVSNISDAISVDLVTAAGAGGKILEMLEGEKKMAKQVVKEAEDKKKDMIDGLSKDQPSPDKAKAEAGEAPPAQDGDDSDHADKDQDVALIKQMIKKHMGKGDASDDEGDDADKHVSEAEAKEMEAMEAEAKEVYEMAKADGMDKEPAMKCAEMHMKHAMKMKQKQKESKEAEAEGKEAQKESAAIIKLKGENQKLRESLKKIEIEKYIDKKLAETGLARSATKKIRESMTSVKIEKEVDERIALFMEGYKSAEAGEGESEMYVSVEKQGTATKGLDFSDCE